MSPIVELQRTSVQLLQAADPRYLKIATLAKLQTRARLSLAKNGCLESLNGSFEVGRGENGLMGGTTLISKHLNKPLI